MPDDSIPGERSRGDGTRSPDSELLRRYAEEKSEVAFAALVDRYVDLVYSAALRQVGGDAHRAHDVAQDVFTALARKSAALAHHPVLAGWLYTSTQLEAAKVRRTEARRLAREHAAHLMNEHSDLAPKSADWEEMRPVLDDAMRALGEHDRQAVLLRYFAQRPFAEIGAALNVSEDGARMRVDRALEKLRTLLGRRGITSTTAALGLVLANHAVVAAPAGLATAVTGQVLTAGAAAFDLFAFMSTTKFTAAVTAGILLIAVGVTYREIRQEAAVAAAFASAQQVQTRLLAQVRTTQAQARVAEDELAAAETALRRVQTAPGANPPAARLTPTVPTPDELAAGRAFLDRNPPLKTALLERSRARVASRYRPLYRTLNLTAEQIQRFEALMIEGEGVNMGAPDGSQLLLRPGTGLSQSEVNEQVHALLGDAGFQQFQEATRQLGARGTALQVAGALYFTDTPLTGPQSDLLVQAIDGSRMDTRQSRDPGAYWTMLLERAHGFLSAPQIAVLAGMQQQQDFERALSAARAGWTLPGWGGAAATPGKKP